MKNNKNFYSLENLKLVSTHKKASNQKLHSFEKFYFENHSYKVLAFSFPNSLEAQKTKVAAFLTSNKFVLSDSDKANMKIKLSENDIKYLCVLVKNVGDKEQVNILYYAKKHTQLKKFDDLLKSKVPFLFDKKSNEEMLEVNLEDWKSTNKIEVSREMEKLKEMSDKELINFLGSLKSTKEKINFMKKVSNMGMKNKFQRNIFISMSTVRNLLKQKKENNELSPSEENELRNSNVVGLMEIVNN